MSEGNDDRVLAWFAGRLPGDWFEAEPAIEHDRDEILVTGTLPDVDLTDEAAGRDPQTARLARIARFREETRDRRIRIAREAEREFGLKVSWAARCGGQERPFTTLSLPAMTRLRMPERRVLDTLIDAGVARSRSESLAWCVRLVARNEKEWLGKLQDAFEQVQRVRDEGPSA